MAISRVSLVAASFITVLAASLTAQETSPTVDEAVSASHVMISAWQCSAYAELVGHQEELQRLFEVGYQAGHTLLSLDLTGKGMTWNEFMGKLPATISLSIGAPSIEFQLGRWQQMMLDTAFAKIVETDQNGRPVGPRDYVHDPDIRRLKAKELFRDSNCELID